MPRWSERGLAGLALGVVFAAATAQAEPAPGRQAELLYLLKQDCGSCHGMTLKGGLGPSLLPPALAGRSERDLAAVILDGLPGTAMPPWGFEIGPGEAAWLARRLRQGRTDAP